MKIPFIRCDLPYLEVRLLCYLARRALESQVDVTVPESIESRVQPLCAVYRQRVLAVIRASLEAGRNETSGFFRRVRCQVIPGREIAQAGFPAGIFANMNTRDDYVAAKRIVNSEL